MTSPSDTLIGTCFICKRRHDNLGVAPHERATIKWFCSEHLGNTNLQKAYHMPRKLLDQYEEQALEDGGNAGGEYLDSIQKTDLADLAPEEWREFLGIVLKGYANSMREIVSREVPY